MDTLEEFEKSNGRVAGEAAAEQVVDAAFRAPVSKDYSNEPDATHAFEAWESASSETDHDKQKVAPVDRRCDLTVDVEGFSLSMKGDVDNSHMWRGIIKAMEIQSHGVLGRFMVMGRPCALGEDRRQFFRNLGAQVSVEDPPPGVDPFDYTDKRIGAYLAGECEAVAASKDDGTKPIFWVATHDAKGAFQHMLRGVNPAIVDRGLVLRMTESSVNGAGPDTSLMRVIEAEEAVSGHQVLRIDVSTLEALASGRIAKMQHLLLEGKEEKASRLAGPREKRRLVKLSQEERELALAAELSLLGGANAKEAVDEEAVDEETREKRPRLTPAEEITPIGESEQSKTPLTDSQMEANIKAFLSEKASKTAVNACEGTASSNGGGGSSSGGQETGPRGGTGAGGVCGGTDSPEYDYTYSDTESLADDEEQEQQQQQQPDETEKAEELANEAESK